MDEHLLSILEGENMIRRRITLYATLLALTLCFASLTASAQTTSVFTTGLSQPIKIISTPGGNFIVAEAGNGPNTGRISIIDEDGNRNTLIDGLPAAVTAEGGNSGPSGLDLRGRTLFVTIGEGDGVLPGPIAGTQVPNPNPSSPLLSSVLALHFSANVEKGVQPFTLTFAQQTALANGADIVLDNGAGDRLTIELIADLPNYVPAPLPFFPANVRNSNPFGVVAAAKSLYVVNAGLNAVLKVNILTGNFETVATFAPRPNPLPFGPPVIDAVPDSIRLVGDQVFVPLLTGFPFVQGLSEVRRVDLSTGSNTSYIGGLTSAIDVFPIKARGNSIQLLVLQFSANFLANLPGKLLLFDGPAAQPFVIADNLISPTSMARDPKSGDMLITEIFTGRIIRVQLP
jgi:hypothetical protein